MNWLRNFVSKGLRRFAQWLGRSGIKKTSAKVILVVLVCVVALTVSILYAGGKDFGNSNWGAAAINIFADLIVSLFVALLGIATWFATSYYKEEEFTIHLFRYDENAAQLSLPARWLTQDIVEDLNIAKSETFISVCKIDQRDEIMIDRQIAEELLQKNTASIAILPFSEMVQGMLEICRDRESARTPLWARRRDVEVDRTFALFVTYDPLLDTSAPSVRSIRFFSTPLIDTAAIVSNVIGLQISKLILVGDPEGSFRSIERALQTFVSDKIKRVKVLEPRVEGIVHGMTGNYVLEDNEKVAVFAITVDPSIELLQRLESLERAVRSRGGEVVAIYVPPTWVRNWRLEDSCHLLTHWDTWLKGRRLMTVLPESLAHYLRQRKEAKAFDIISFYTQNAFRFAKHLRQVVIDQGGAPYNRIAESLESTAHKLVHDDAEIASFSFQRIFSTGEIYYDPIIVSFQPNNTRTDFSITIGKEGSD